MTIDGLGPVGGGAHASDEYVLASSLEPRAQVALAANYALFRAKVGPDCAVAGVIKADGYGLGVDKVLAEPALAGLLASYRRDLVVDAVRARLAQARAAAGSGEPAPLR